MDRIMTEWSERCLEKHSRGDSQEAVAMAESHKVEEEMCLFSPCCGGDAPVGYGERTQQKADSKYGFIFEWRRGRRERLAHTV